MDSNYFDILSNRYETVLSEQMTESLGKSVINLYSNIACSALCVGNQQDLSNDLECDSFLNTALQRFTCDLYHSFGAFLAPISVGIITGKHYTKHYSPKLMADQTTETVKEYTEQQINEMDSNYFNILSNRYESVLSEQMTESLGKSVINLYSNIACSALCVGNQQDFE